MIATRHGNTTVKKGDKEVLDALSEAAKQETDTQASDEKYRLCTIIKKKGSAPRGVGTQMLVSSDNRSIGTIGGGCAEAEVISLSLIHI